MHLLTKSSESVSSKPEGKRTELSDKRNFKSIAQIIMNIQTPNKMKSNWHIAYSRWKYEKKRKQKRNLKQETKKPNAKCIDFSNNLKTQLFQMV